jgi:benzoate/toluate 1,2-dioxygenase subunit beta
LIVNASLAGDVERECSRFLYHEALLLDERDYDGWFALFAADASYWIPLREGQPEPYSELNIAFDDATRLADRVARLNSGIAYAQDPPSRTSRTIANIMVDAGEANEVVVRSAFAIVEVRAGLQQIWGGRYTHRLRQRTDGGLEIVQKKIELTNSQEPMLNLGFLL